MTSIKAVIRKSRPNMDGTCNIRIRIIKDRATSFFAIGHSVMPADFDEEQGGVLRSHPNATRLNLLIDTLKIRFMDEILKAETEEFSVSIKKIRQNIKPRYSDFFEFAEGYIKQYNNDKQQYTFVKYELILKRMRECTGASKLKFNDFNYNLLEKLNKYLISIGNGPNTRRSSFEKLAKLYKEAARVKLVDRNNSPFYEFDPGKRQKAKKKVKLSIEEMNKIRGLDLQEGTNLWHSRNAVLFSYNFMGMRIGDVITAKVSTVSKGTLSYRMKKSDDYFSEIEFTAEVKTIIDHYIVGKGEDDYLFPFMDATNPEASYFKRIDSCNSLIRNNLKKIGEMAGITKHITSHVFRHSYAQRAKERGLVQFAQDLLGHSKSSTTEGYLESLGSERLSEINKKVLEE